MKYTLGLSVLVMYDVLSLEALMWSYTDRQTHTHTTHTHTDKHTTHTNTHTSTLLILECYLYA